MELTYSSKKIREILSKAYTNIEKSPISKEFSADLGNFLIKYLKSHAQPSQTSKIIKALPFYLPHYPLKYFISLNAYFSHGHIQDKVALLELLYTFYFFNPKLIDICLSPLITSSFRAVTDSIEISNRVVEILDQISPRNKVYECIWKTILRSPKARLPALYYLHYRLVVDNKLRALNALLVCLDDQSLQVKRSALDLIRRVFNFNSPDVEKKYKITILNQALKLLVNNDRPVFIRIFEWISPNQESQLDQNAVEILSEALLELLQTVEIEICVLIINNFICNLPKGDQLLKKIIIPIAIYNCENKIILVSDSITNFLITNMSMFWSQFLDAFSSSFKDFLYQESLYKVLEHSLIHLKYDHKIIDSLVSVLFANIHLNTEKYMNYILYLLFCIDQTSITETKLQNLYSKIDSNHWTLFAKILLRFYKLQVNCKPLLEKICKDYWKADNNKIEVINIRLEYDQTLITKEYAEFVVKYSMDNKQSETLLKIIQKIPKKLNSSLENLIIDYSELGIECIIHTQKLNLTLTTSLLIKIIDLLSDPSPFIRFKAFEWLNSAVANNCDLLCAFIDSLESKNKTPSAYIPESAKILIAIKELVKLGGENLLNVLLIKKNSKILSVLENLIINPPHHSILLRTLAFEVACNIVKFSKSEVSSSLIDIAVSTLSVSIKNEDNKLLLLLLNVLENHLLVLKSEAESEIHSKGLVNILETLVKILGYPEKIVRNSWISFISQLVPFVIEYLEDSISVNYVNSILKKYFSLFTQNNEKKIFFSIFNLTFKILNLIRHDRAAKNVSKLVYFSLQKYLDLALQNQNSDLFDESIELLVLLYRSNMGKFAKSFVFMWNEYCPYDKRFWSTLESYIEVLVKMKVDLLTFMNEILKFLMKPYNYLPDHEEKVLSIGCLLYKLQEKLIITKATDYWTVSMEIYKLLLKNSLLENNAFVLASMHILKNRIGMDEFNYFSQLELKIIMKNCFSASISCMQSSILAYLLPYPFIFTTTEVSISTVFIIVLKNVIYNVITIGVSTIEIQIALPRLIADFSKTVYIAFTNNELLVTNAADVLSVCLENEKFAVSDTLHDSVIKLIKQSYFLELFKGKPQVLMKWIFIVKTISVSFYKEKNKL